MTEDGNGIDIPAQVAETENEPVEEFETQTYRKSNTLTIWGNKHSMNLNHMVYENISQSPYYRNKLVELTTYHELVDEIYYNVSHLEPWERGTRKITGQTGMCGGVRGVGAGGVVSTPFCIMYKLFVIKLPRKQVYSMLNHTDSPYIRGLGFMYVRFALEPSTFWEWYEPYLEDEEHIDPKAGGGDPTTIGQMVKMFLTKLDWYGTLFPRIPVPVQKEIDAKMKEHNQRVLSAKAVDYEEKEENVVETKGDVKSRDRSRSRCVRRSKSVDKKDSRKRSERRSRDRSLRNGSPSCLSRRDLKSRSGSRSHRRKSPDDEKPLKKSSESRSKRPRSHSKQRKSHSKSHKHHKSDKEHRREKKHKRHHREKSKEKDSNQDRELKKLEDNLGDKKLEDINHDKSPNGMDVKNRNETDDHKDDEPNNEQQQSMEHMKVVEEDGELVDSVSVAEF